MKLPPLNIELPLTNEAERYRWVVGMSAVGCLKHDQIVWFFDPPTPDWHCPECGFQPTGEGALTVTAIDYAAGTITVS